MKKYEIKKWMNSFAEYMLLNNNLIYFDKLEIKVKVDLYFDQRNLMLYFFKSDKKIDKMMLDMKIYSENWGQLMEMEYFKMVIIFIFYTFSPESLISCSLDEYEDVYAKFVFWVFQKISKD